jgi:RNA polymerase sigma-70 factor (ECF subfamily)
MPILSQSLTAIFSGQPPREREISGRDAFTRLYDEFFDKIYWYCRHRLGTAEAAEDAASLVFANALAAGPRYNDPALRSWLFAIAHNVLANTRRSARPHQPLELAVGVADTAPLPDEAAISAEERATLLRALQRLPDDQRHADELRMAGLTGPEIARTLGKSHPAVKMLQMRAYARLRALLTEGVEGEGRVGHG